MIKPIDETAQWGAEINRKVVPQGATLRAVRDTFFENNAQVAEVVPRAGEVLYIEGPDGQFETKAFKRMKDGSLRVYLQVGGTLFAHTWYEKSPLDEYTLFQKPKGSEPGPYPPPTGGYPPHPGAAAWRLLRVGGSSALAAPPPPGGYPPPPGGFTAPPMAPPTPTPQNPPVVPREIQDLPSSIKEEIRTAVSKSDIFPYQFFPSPDYPNFYQYPGAVFGAGGRLVFITVSPLQPDGHFYFNPANYAYVRQWEITSKELNAAREAEAKAKVDAAKAAYDAERRKSLEVEKKFAAFQSRVDQMRKWLGTPPTYDGFPVYTVENDTAPYETGVRMFKQNGTDQKISLREAPPYLPSIPPRGHREPIEISDKRDQDKKVADALRAYQESLAQYRSLFNSREIEAKQATNNAEFERLKASAIEAGVSEGKSYIAALREPLNAQKAARDARKAKEAEQARKDAEEKAEEKAYLDSLRAAAAGGDIGATVKLKSYRAPNITFQLYKKNKVTNAWEPLPKYFDLEQGATNPYEYIGGLTENKKLKKMGGEKTTYDAEEAAVYVPRTPNSRFVCFNRGQPIPVTAYTYPDPLENDTEFDMYQVPGGQETNAFSQEALTATLNSDSKAVLLGIGDEGFIYEAELTQAEVNKLYAEYFKNETKIMKEKIDTLIEIDPVETLKSKKYTEKVEKLKYDFYSMAGMRRGVWFFTGSKGPEPVVQKATAAEVQKWQDEATIYANKQVIEISKKIIENLELLLKYDNLTAEKRYKSTYEPILVKYRAALEEATLAPKDIESLRAKARQGFDVEYNSAVKRLAKGLKDNTVPQLDTFITKEEILQFTGLDLERIIKDILFDKLKGYRDAVKAEINTTAFKSQPELKPFIESKIEGYAPRAEVDATKAIIKGYAAANKAGIQLLKEKNDSKIKKDDSLAAYAPDVKNAYAAKRDFLFESAKTNVISKMSNLMMISGSNTYKDAPAYQADLLATVTPIADELAKNQQKEAAAIDVIRCRSKLAAFKQYSGQCWNDTISILLMFSDGIGPLTQIKLQDDELLAQFRVWLNAQANEDFIKSQAPANLSPENLASFKEASELYLKALQDRYKNSEAKRAQNAARAALEASGAAAPARRQASIECSLTLEASSILANEFLLPADKQSPLKLGTIKSASNILAGIRAQKTDGTGQLRSLLGYMGYHITKAAPFIRVIVRFFSDTSILINEFHPSLAKNIRKGETLMFVDSTDYYKRSLYTPINSYKTLKELPNGTSISVSVTVSSRDAADNQSNSHSISFIECGGSQYVYDDNIGKLQSIGWRSMLINNSEDILHIYAYNFDAAGHAISSYIGIWIPSNPTKYFKLQDGRGLETEVLTDPIPTNHKEAFYKIQAKYPRNQQIRIISNFGLIILNRASVVREGGRRKIRKNYKKTIRRQRIQGKKSRKQSRR